MTGLDVFTKQYSMELSKAVIDHPEDYPWWPQTQVSAVVARMRQGFERGSFNKDCHAIKNTCKVLGIKYTYGAIREYFKKEIS